MKNTISIETDSLKNFLQLFNKEETIFDLELGDTWYPTLGFIDQTILEGKSRINDILEFDYDFRGLVMFKGKLESLQFRLTESETMVLTFEISDFSETTRRKLTDKITELNAYQPSAYRIIK